VSLNCINKVVQLDDDSYICCGRGSFISGGSGLRPENSIIMRVDSHGNLVWCREFDAGWHEMLLDMELTETGVFCVGYAENNTKIMAFPLWIICDFDGENSIVRTLPDLYSYQIFISSITNTTDNNYIFGGRAGNYSVLIKTNNVGDTIKTSLIGNGGYPGQLSITALSNVNNNILVFGYYTINLHDYDSQNYYAFYDTNLTFLSENILPFDNELQLVNPTQLVTVSDNEFIIGGWLSVENRQEDIFIKKYNMNDELVWQRFMGGTGMENIYELIHTSDGGYMVVGDSDSFNDWIAIYLVKTDSLGLGNYTSPVQEYQAQNTDAFLYPNPAYEKCELIISNYQAVDCIQIYDLYGKCVKTYPVTNATTTLNLSNLQPGIYIVTDNNRSFQRKLIKTIY
ncbi:MAG: T9SS type A sorting domain-containing protein, partial [Paludibacteraceae bacterium]|nr:T9SS type A sorting domain-containing protein [Paludibacteraceae bacterium]